MNLLQLDRLLECHESHLKIFTSVKAWILSALVGWATGLLGYAVGLNAGSSQAWTRPEQTSPDGYITFAALLAMINRSIS